MEKAEVGPKFFEASGPGVSWVLWLVLPTVMYTLIGQDFYQRLFACRSKKVARLSALAGGLFLVAISFFPAFIGAGARALSDIEDSTQAIPWVLQNLVPPVLGGVLWPRATRAGALAALAGGSLVATIGLIIELEVGGMPTEIWSAGVSLLIFVVVSLMTDPPKGVVSFEA